MGPSGVQLVDAPMARRAQRHESLVGLADRPPVRQVLQDELDRRPAMRRCRNEVSVNRTLPATAICGERRAHQRPILILPPHL